MDRKELTLHFIMRCDEQLERLEEHGGRAERYAQLMRAVTVAQKRLYRLSKPRQIVMAEVPSILSGKTAVVWGQKELVLEQSRWRSMVYDQH